jgi:hypothetical protein
MFYQHQELNDAFFAIADAQLLVLAKTLSKFPIMANFTSPLPPIFYTLVCLEDSNHLGKYVQL